MKALTESTTRPTGLNRRVVIVARRTVQNGALAGLIAEKLACGCEVRDLYQLDGAPVPLGELALLDVEGMSVSDIARCADALCANDRDRAIALFNAEQTKLDDIVLPGVKGVFFRDASPEHLLKGVRAILAGEYWLPRKVLSAHFERNRPERVRSSPRPINLTPKEAETLELLVRGNGNHAIALRLGVSPHTVKTHVYNLFRKLGVKNRVQAVNWAMLNAERIGVE